VDEATYRAKLTGWLPSAEDYSYVERCMVPVVDPGKVAAWVAPPTRGFGGKALDFEYVQFH
jgi:benzoyl-CoA 2,3-dioxygenase component B